MKWTRKKPTEAGLYLIRMHGKEKAHTITYDGFWFRMDGGGFTEKECHESDLWFGPIPTEVEE